MPLVVHDEPVLENGKVVGLTTSGARGMRTGLTLALALVRVAPGETAAQTSQRQFEVNIAGTRYATVMLPKPPYDPRGERMTA